MTEIRYDPYDFEVDANPHPVWRRMRDEAPLYRNDEYGFWALSRYQDVVAGLTDWRTYSSARGTLLELIRNDVQFPPGMMIFEDPPLHDAHRALMARVFSPRRIAQIEPRVRAYCASSLDPLVGGGRIDFIADLGSQMPMRVVGMLLGIPEEDQEELRDAIDAGLSLEEGGSASPTRLQGEQGPVDQAARFSKYIEWRRKNPSDDLMTELLNARFVDDHGDERTLRDDELLGYISLLAAAGNETTTRLIGWTAYLLDRFPDQRRLLAEDRSLVPNAVEEILRYEAPSPVQARYVTRDVELHGTRVPEGSTLLLLNGSANRDEREFENADRLDVKRRDIHHLSFGYGIHFCLGASLARLEGRVALEEILARWTEWEIDHEGAEMARTSTVRGWKTLPARIVAGSKGRPMFLAPDDAEILIADTAARFLSRTIPLDRLHGTGASPALTADLRAEFAAMGWFGLVLPEAEGGSGLSAVEHALFYREVGRHCGPVDILAQALAAMVTDDRRLRAGLLAGEQGVVLAVGDGATLRLLGSHDATLALHAERDGARLLDVSVTETGPRPSLDPATGMRAIVRGTPRTVAVSSDGDVWSLGQLGVAAMQVGVADTALALIVEYAQVRETFGRKIGTYQAVRHPCADMALRAEAARCQLWSAAAAFKERRSDAHAHLDAAKHLANRAALMNADADIQLHGGIGVTEEHHAHLLLKHGLLLARLFGSKRTLLARLLHAELEV